MNKVIVLVLLSIPGLNLQSVDRTLLAGESGRDVVIASINKIRRGSFTNDFELLERIALVESAFGTNETVIRNNPGGGIWQITDAIYIQLVDGMEQLQPFIDDFSYLGDDIVQITDNNNFQIPLQSAFSARLYIELIQQNGGGQLLPGSIDGQADWWANNYNLNGNRDKFIERVTLYEESETCTIDRIDLWFLLDQSGSVGADQFNLALQFIVNISQSLIISSDRVRVGFAVYNSDIQYICKFDEHTDNAAFSEAVLNVQYDGGGTITGQAIQNTVTTGFSELNGLRPLDDAVPRVLILLTDGRSFDLVEEPANSARNKSIIVVAVGIGDYVREQLVQIANSPPSRYLFELESFNSLTPVFEDSLNEASCQVNTRIPDNTTIPLTIQPGEVLYTVQDVPRNGSIELEYVISDGQGIVYISGSVENPNSAVYDYATTLNVNSTVIMLNVNDFYTTTFEIKTIRSQRRRIANGFEMVLIYTAIQTTGDQPLVIDFRSTGRTTKFDLTGSADGTGPNLILLTTLWLLILYI